MQSTLLKKALAIGLAWLPSLFWLLFAVTGVIMGAGGLFSDSPMGGLIFIALGFAGILGFIGLTVVCWTRKPVTGTLAAVLLCGALALMIAAGFLVSEGDWDLRDPITLLQLTYFVVCPVIFGLYKAASYFRAPSTP